MIQACFDFAGSLLEVTADDNCLIEPLGTFLGDLRVEKSDHSPTFRLSIRHGTPASLPDGAHIICDELLPDEGKCRFAEIGRDLYLLFPGKLSLRLYGGKPRAEMVVTPGCEEKIGATAGMHAIDAAITASGQYLIHAAGLTLPGGARSILVYGPSGTGKTTTALALASFGFGLCSDDAMVVQINSADAWAWGLPRNLKVHRHTCAMLPWLKPLVSHDWDQYDEQVLTRSKLRSVVDVEPAKRTLVAGLFELVRTGDPTCTVEPLSRADALVSLIADNVRAGHTGLLPAGQKLFDALSLLVMNVPAYQIRLSDDAEETGPALLRVLEEEGPP